MAIWKSGDFCQMADWIIFDFVRRKMHTLINVAAKFTHTHTHIYVRGRKELCQPILDYFGKRPILSFSFQMRSNSGIQLHQSPVYEAPKGRLKLHFRVRIVVLFMNSAGLSCLHITFFITWPIFAWLIHLVRPQCDAKILKNCRQHQVPETPFQATKRTED